MREIQLIKDLEYGYKSEVIEGGKLNYNNYIYNILELTRKVYNADELVDVDSTSSKHVETVKNSFINTFDLRGGATNEQISFAEETAKIVFGELKKDIVTVIPAPCGFGKSSISLEILKEIIQLHKSKKTTNGLILVTDRLDSLRETKDLLNKIGLGGYCYILESWNEHICKNKKIKESNGKICTPKTCPYFSQCKISYQQNEQKKYPILMITNARLKESGININIYKKWNKGNRTTLLIDERPNILDTVKVNKALLNTISTEISNCEYTDTAEKTKFENMFKDIQNIVTDKMQQLRKNYKRFIVSEQTNTPIIKTDKEFMGLWNKYMKGKYNKELNAIHTVITKGGFYVYEKNTEFISTIKSKDLKEMYSKAFKTIIFDGTALYDPLYLGMYNKESIKFLNVKNTREYNNLNINAYTQYKLTKTNFNNKPYLIKACAKFANNRLFHGINTAYIVTYQSISARLNKYLNKMYNIVKLNQDEVYYFGNTKGKNDMKNCNIMFQFGWDTLPDYEYVIQWLSVCVEWDKILEFCKDFKKAEEISEPLEIKDRSTEKFKNNTYSSNYKCYKFGLEGINRFKIFTIVTNFYQEIHRIKLRNYNCTKETIEINVFNTDAIIFEMLKQLLHNCKLTKYTDKIDCFAECKITDRKNKCGTTYAQKILNYINNDWDGKEIKTKELLKGIGITQKQFDKSKEKNNDLKELLKNYMIKRGTYKKI